MTAIKLMNLTKKFKDFVAVDNVNLEIEEGELFALLGVNGAGKTTTIKMLSCLSSPTCGDATLNGYSILNDTNKIKEFINISPQETAVALNLTVKENLIFFAEIYGFNKENARIKANEMIDMFGLGEKAKSKAKLLSGGMQRRLSIAMALISNPKILFLDEPTLGLDVIARRELWKHILALKGKITIVLTTHYMEEVEALSDRVAIMVGGKIKIVGNCSEIMVKTESAKFEDAFVKICTEEGNI